MKELKRITFFCALLLLLSICPMSVSAFAETPNGSGTVSVTLPSFPVSLNGMSLDNRCSQYPLLVYRDITYFPMTYYDCRLLGLKTDWNPSSGLSISKNDDPFYEYLRQLNETGNASVLKADIVSQPVTVNGTSIDNSQEPYPLLLFRNVTYFPLTWKFAVDQFGWDYNFSEKTGLTVTAKDVVFQNPNPWGNFRSTYGNGHGSDYIYLNYGMYNADLPADTSASKADHYHQAAVAIDLYGSQDHTVTLEPVTSEIQIAKNVKGHKELVYQYLFPTFQGTLGISEYTSYTAPIPFNVIFPPGSPVPGTENKQLGDYYLSVISPKQVNYRLDNNSELNSSEISYANNMYCPPYPFILRPIQ